VDIDQDTSVALCRQADRVDEIKRKVCTMN
jgi:hypothetical protein